MHFVPRMPCPHEEIRAPLRYGVPAPYPFRHSPTVERPQNVRKDFVRPFSLLAYALVWGLIALMPNHAYSLDQEAHTRGMPTLSDSNGQTAPTATNQPGNVTTVTQTRGSASPSPKPDETSSVVVTNGGGPVTTATRTQPEVYVPAVPTQTAAPANNESAAVRSIDLDEEGTDKFYGGVEKIAIGIANLHDAEKSRPGDENDEAHTSAVAQIAEGTHDVELGHDIVNQANAIKESENRMTSVGASEPMPIHQLAYDAAKAPSSTQAALSAMEERTGHPAAALIEAVNRGSTDEVVQFAGGVSGSPLARAQVTAAIPAFGSSSPAAAPAVVSMAGAPAKLAAPTGVTAKKAARTETRQLAANGAAKPAALGGDQEGSLQPLSGEQFFKSFTGAGFNEPAESLFHRVRAQYYKRRSDLIRRSASLRP